MLRELVEDDEVDANELGTMLVKFGEVVDDGEVMEVLVENVLEEVVTG